MNPSHLEVGYRGILKRTEKMFVNKILTFKNWLCLTFKLSIFGRSAQRKVTGSLFICQLPSANEELGHVHRPSCVCPLFSHSIT